MQHKISAAFVTTVELIDDDYLMNSEQDKYAVEKQKAMGQRIIFNNQCPMP
ncbi:hypothetical protein [Nostoc sp. UHCC 0252]|uniref:hypothetical protein n=1 Tax=Nostoc sp. UHCC 0252 TaxID=3110241 RepID=UPI002B2042B7|nr:hypothetical protein [Nostoc sp. UHCC 0252]MEA5600030.1 hypothetical protein [Nostoc sp. UHCC 0252]